MAARVSGLTSVAVFPATTARNASQVYSTIIIHSCLETLFNIVEAPFKELLNFNVCVVWWCSDGSINSQGYKSFEIYAVTIKISMTEYHHWLNGQANQILF